MSLQWKRLYPLPRKGRFQIESTNPAFRHSKTMVEDVVIFRQITLELHVANSETNKI
jgi:hypothetical protein